MGQQMHLNLPIEELAAEDIFSCLLLAVDHVLLSHSLTALAEVPHLNRLYWVVWKINKYAFFLKHTTPCMA